ncbi:MAG TPA: hypothetical protein DCX14_15415 [Flavobacteriales bacterium]|nr:hypothetical protein [Flavobacteriales bacterium]
MKKLLLTAFGLAFGITAVQAQYYVIEETGEVSGYSWDGTGTTILDNPADDVYSPAQTIPFTFDYYGNSVTSYLASDNGYITFDVTSTTSDPANTAIPTTGGPNNAIYAAWTDLALLTGAGTPDVVKNWTYGTSPNRTHVIQWHSVRQVGTTGYMYAAILLHEAGGFDVVLPWAQGCVPGFTVGCENATGGDGIEINGAPNYTIPSNTDVNSDDFVIHFIAGTQPAVDPKMVSATIPTYASPDGSRAIVGTVQNLGANTLNSFDISWTDGTTTKTATINNSLASGATYDFEHPDEVTVAAGTTSNITVSVEVSGDANMNNNTASGDVDGYVFVPHKAVFGEEATGTWCGWCPRGMVGMEYMEEEYEDEWVGVAVHNGDPMTNSDYDSWMGSQISGYPSGLVNRGGDIDPSWTSLEGAFNDAINEFGVADIEVLPLINDDDEVEIRINFHFAEDYDDDVRVAVLLAEDDLSGSGSQWNQANYYSGGGSGSLSGAGFDWHAEASSVAGVTYNDVARQSVTDIDGEDDIIEAPFAEDEVVSVIMDKFDWDGDYDMDNTTIIVVLIDDNSDEVINVAESHLKELEIVENGGVTYYVIDGDTYQLWDGETLVPTGVATAPSYVDVKVYPNPSNGMINVALGEAAEVLLIDMMGKVVASSTFTGNSNGVQFNAEYLSAGVYNVVVRTETSTATERVTVIK